MVDPWFLGVAIPAVLLTGIDKGGFAGGAGVLIVPLLALVVSPLQGAGIMLPILLLMDLIVLKAYWRQWDRPTLRLIAIGGLFGLGVGTLTAGMLTEAAVRLLLGVLALAFALNYWFGPKQFAARAASVPKGLFWSTLGGFGNFIAHAGGPALNIYLVPLRLEKMAFLGTATAFWALLNYAKLPSYIALGMVTMDNFRTALLLLPFAPLGVWIGYRLQGRVSTAGFYRVVYVMMTVVGAKLAWDGARALLAAA